MFCPEACIRFSYYGLWNPSNREALRSLQIALAQDNPTKLLSAAELPVETVWAAPIKSNLICPHYGKGVLVLERIISKGEKPP